MSGADYVKAVSPGDAGLWPDARGPSLERFDIELTERCDNDCVHCCVRLHTTMPSPRAGS